MLSDKEYLKITVPFMLATMTQPLMGAVNTAVMGQLPQPEYIAAVALGAILFNNLYWLFGFLRVSTTGYAAQALGAADKQLSLLAFFKPLVLALLVGFLCIVLQVPIVEGYLRLIAPAEQVGELCRRYFTILIWGAPLVLFNYVALGWMMGQAQIRASVLMQVSSNVLNIILSMLFVLVLGYGIEGVAVATLLSQLYGAVVGAVLMHYLGRFDYRSLPLAELLDWRSFTGMLKVNANLMIRTACLLTVNNIIAAVGASLGTVVLAANAVLLQLKDLMSYLIDGMANGAAIFTGKAVGQRSAALLERTLAVTYKWLAVLTVLLTGGYYLGSSFFISLFTDIGSVLTMAQVYSAYILLYPLLSGVGMVLYGVFCGATYTAPVRNMMIGAAAVFYLVQWALVPPLGNHGLWIALLAYMLAQSVIMYVYLRRTKEQLLTKSHLA